MDTKKLEEYSIEEKMLIYSRGYSTHIGIPIRDWLLIADETRSSKFYRVLRART